LRPLLIMGLFILGVVRGAWAQNAQPEKPYAPRDSVKAITHPLSESPERLALTPPPPGPVIPHVPPPQTTMDGARTWLGDQELKVWGRYNRVEGPALHIAVVRPLKPEGFIPAFRAQFGYAFSAERGQYFAGFEQPVAPHHRVTVGAQGYRSFLPFYYADESLSSGENSASALFLHRDYWDWYEAEGLRAFANFYVTRTITLTTAMRKDDEASLRNANDWSVFNPSEEFPENPAILDGEYRGYEVSAAYDTRPRQDGDNISQRSTWPSWTRWHRISWERGDGGLGGDFDLWRVTGDFRNYFRIAPNQNISTRLLAGTGEGEGGFLPPERRYEIGGLGTLRGHNYRSLRGDHVALGNVQYAIGVGHRGWALAFLDAGTAWDSGSLFDQHIPIDLGTGFRIGQSGPTLLIAHGINDSSADWRVQFRFQESY
jgi:hypothetical protein